MLTIYFNISQKKSCINVQLSLNRYVHRLEITPVERKEDLSIFPFNRWVDANTSINIVEFDSCLPQDDVNPEQRAKELRAKREDYMFSGRILGAPPQVRYYYHIKTYTSLSFSYIFPDFQGKTTNQRWLLVIILLN